MAARLLSYEVADLCLGKPPLLSLSISATIGDAVATLKGSEHGRTQSPVSVLLSKVKGLVRHVEPSSSLVEVIDLMLQGAQNLVVPLRSNSKRKQLQKSSSTTHNVCQFCWLTLEDVIRFLLCSIGLFSPIPTLSIDSLAIISTEFWVIGSHSPAASAVGAIYRSLVDQTSVAVVDDGGILIGEISPSTLAACGAEVTAATATLSAGELMAYIDCGGGPPEEISRVVEARLKERNLEKILDKFMTTPCEPHIASLDDDLPSPMTTMSKSGRYGRSSSYSAKMARRAEEIVCHPGSSLVAVMVQAIAHRVNYVWVIEDDCSVVGIVTFFNMLEIFRENLESIYLKIDEHRKSGPLSTCLV